MNLELRGRVLRTGPIAATMAPMTVDFVGPRGFFAKVEVPQIKTSSSGTEVYVPAQKVRIAKADAFFEFVETVLRKKTVDFGLDNGKGTVKAMFMSASINFKKQVQAPGMDSLALKVLKTEVLNPELSSNSTVKVSLTVSNPSPFEIDLPTSTFDVVDEQGTIIAELHGELSIARGDSVHELTGALKTTATTSIGETRLIGKSVKTDGWMKNIIQYFDAPFELDTDFINLV